MTVQVPVPVQAPLQPVNVEPAPDGRQRDRRPVVNAAEQVAPQLIPAGVLVTEPDPEPALVTVRVCVISVNVAVTDWSALIVTVQVPVPVQPRRSSR